MLLEELDIDIGKVYIVELFDLGIETRYSLEVRVVRDHYLSVPRLSHS
jgi:hypothetical protein